MPIQLTPAQETAVSARPRTLLVSAAAGSGKTHTLTERIIRRVTDPQDPVDLSRLLVVTFTRDAAAELRKRLHEKLSAAVAERPSDVRMQRQLLSLAGARISTIDAFYKDAVRRHFNEIGLPPSLRIADDAELDPIRERVMETLIDEFFLRYATRVPNAAKAAADLSFDLLEGNLFADLCDCLTPSKNDAKLVPALLDLYNRMLSYPEGFNLLRLEADKLERRSLGDFFLTPHGMILRRRKDDICRSALRAAEAAARALEGDSRARGAYGDAVEQDLTFFRRLLQAKGLTDTLLLCDAYEPARLKPLRHPSEACLRYREARTAAQKALTDFSAKYLLWSDRDTERDIRHTVDLLRVLHLFLTEYDRRILEEKRRRGVCDFSDNARFLHDILRGKDGQPSQTALAYREQFDEIYIDEYQDVDERQDEIFRLIGGRNRFMVGDIKQSIYEFRGANPTVFSRYRRTLPPLSADREDEGNSLFMSENFRCDEPVIRVANAVCGHLFRLCPLIGYRKRDDLCFAKQTAEGYRPFPVDLTVIRRIGRGAPEEEEEGGEPPAAARPETAEDGRVRATGPRPIVRVEADYVAGRIADLLRSGATLANGRPIQPKDIVVLMRYSAAMPIFAGALRDAGIPTGGEELDHRQARKDLLHGSAMTYLVNLLRVMDNPDSDVPLSEVLRAPFPGFTLEDLLAVKCGDGTDADSVSRRSLFACLEACAEGGASDPTLLGKTEGFLSWINRYRKLCASHPAERILRFLARDERCSFRASPAFRYLYESARSCRVGSFVSLYDFLRFFERKIATDREVSDAVPAGTDGGHVRIMTIHKAKGLEFPVCFLAQCGRAFADLSAKSDLIFHRRVGVAMKLYYRSDEDGKPCNRKTDTLLRACAALAATASEREEDMRILYVAMTRARERLYIVGVGPRKFPLLSPGDRYAALSCNSYMKWIYGALREHPEAKPWYVLNEIVETDVQPPEPLPPRLDYAVDERAASLARAYREIAARRAKPDPMERLLRQVPTQMAASALTDRILDVSVFYHTDLPSEDGPSDGDGAFTDAQNVANIRKSIERMSSSGGEEFEMILRERQRPTAEERGKATHFFLQYCDYDRVVRYGIEDEIARLLEHGFLSRQAARILEREELSAFFNSRFFAHIRTSEEVLREWRFSRFVPLSSLTANAELARALGDRTLYVRGSIDLLCRFADGSLEICDYKTDRISPAEREEPSLLRERLRAKYAPQLRQYALAVEEIFRRKPERILIYSLPLGEALTL